eukprot:TRINITY_DN721_c0_g1_i1.p1 TRINITY_DN721_c0_g1~~TRINITY_DN721_c0_g1_i1.p1  ORF type:complete len:444 (-),score=116.35 TRINITY_DN721_c0_g1_i1:908-2239(-)
MRVSGVVVLVCVCAALALRVLPYAPASFNDNGGAAPLLPRLASLARHLRDRVELSTPLTSFARLYEGHYLQSSTHLRQANGTAQYAGGVNHQPPLVLLALHPLLEDTLREFKVSILFATLDLLIALMLYRIARWHQRRTLAVTGPRFSHDLLAKPAFPATVAALYLLSPFAVITCAGLSIGVLSNFFTVAAFFCATVQALFPLAVLCLAVATYCSIYPVVFFPTLLVILLHRKQSALLRAIFFVFEFAACLAWLLVLSFISCGSWDFVDAVYRFTVTVQELTPNIGLFWYFFIEIFEHFNTFFIFVFQAHIFVYIVPLAIRFWRYPMLMWWTLAAFLAIFVPYPSVADLTLHLAILPLVWHQVKGNRYSMAMVVMLLSFFLLLPILWCMWITYGSGNANFYYALNLVYCALHLLFIADCLAVTVKQDYLAKHAEPVSDSKKNS